MLGKIHDLNDIIDNLIDIAHEKYFETSDEIERAKLDGRIKAYWEVKNHVENILVVEK